MKSMPMSEPMVQAILGTDYSHVPPRPCEPGGACKYVTRRVIKHQPAGEILWKGSSWVDASGQTHKPRYWVGEGVYVGEAWALIWEARQCPKAGTTWLDNPWVWCYEFVRAPDPA